MPPRALGREIDDAHALLLGQIVQQQRELLGITQADLAQRVGITQVAVSRIERGKTLVDHFTMTRLADVLELGGQRLASAQAAALRCVGTVVWPGRERVESSLWWREAREAGGEHAVRGLAAFAVATVLADERRACEREAKRKKPKTSGK